MRSSLESRDSLVFCSPTSSAPWGEDHSFLTLGVGENDCYSQIIVQTDEDVSVDMRRDPRNHSNKVRVDGRS